MNKQDCIKKLLDENNLEYRLDAKGENYQIKECIFCGNQKFNLEVHTLKGCFKCWACSNTGGHYCLREALLATTARNKIDKDTESDTDALTENAVHFHNKIFFRQEALQYLKSRGFTEESIRHFKIGCQKKNGLWITIPHLKNNRVINIKYRSTPPMDKKWRQEKSVSKVLFNSDVLKSNLEIILVEGELKAIALHQVGIKNVVGLTGGVSNVPQEWVDQLKKMRCVYICMDSDDPGQNASKELAKRIGLNRCRNIALPDAKDPDEYLFDRKHTKNDFLNLMEGASQFDLASCFTGLKQISLVKTEQVDYAWPPYIPLGKLTFLDGNPGVGKSHLSLAIAAALSRGENPWPIDLSFDTPSNEVLIFSQEDGAGDTVKPRLDSLHANQDNIYIFDLPIKFDDNGFRDIETMISTRRPILAIFDTVTEFLPSKTDIYRANETREPLARLRQIAKDNDCAILLLRHLTKGSKDHALYRGIGSIDFVGAARSVLMVGQHPQDESLKIVAHIKSNLSVPGTTLQFRISNGIFKWAGKCDLSVDDILYPNREADQEKIEKAKEFLLRELSLGPTSTKELKKAGLGQGITERTLERAKSMLGIKSRRVGDNGKKGGGHHEWFLPNSENASDSLDLLQ